MSRMLTLEGVTAFYGAIQALKGVDLHVDTGEIVTLIGANGAGKSTLMMTICGTPRARDGRIVYAGEEITRLPTYEIMRRDIAQSPEGRRVFARMSVYENLLMGAHGRPKGEVSETMDQVFHLFPRLKERRDQRGADPDLADRPGCGAAAGAPPGRARPRRRTRPGSSAVRRDSSRP